MHLFGNTKKKSKGLKVLSRSTSSRSTTLLKRLKGFTIIELLVVIVIIGVLAGIVFVVYKGVVNRANHAAVQAEAKQVNDKLAMYNTEFGSYPNDKTFDGFFDDSCTGDYCFDPDDRFSFDYVYPDDREDYCTDSSDCKPTIEVCDPELEICYGYDPRGELLDLTQPSSCPSGFIPITGSALYSQKGFCVMKYEATKQFVSMKIVSGPTGNFFARTNSPSEANTLAEESCDGCHLLTEAEWLTIARDIVSQSDNWVENNIYDGQMYDGVFRGENGPGVMAGTDDNNGYFNVPLQNGQTDIPSRRTFILSNKEVIWDFVGNLPEWTTGESSRDNYQFTDTFNSEWSKIKVKTNVDVNPSPLFGISDLIDEGLNPDDIGSLNIENQADGTPYESGAKRPHLRGEWGIYYLILARSETEGGFRAAK